MESEGSECVGASFTDSVIAHIDTMAEMHGRPELIAKWIKPNLPMINSLTVDSVAWTPAGSDFQEKGRYHINGVGPDKKPMTMSGTFNHNWTKGADGKWLTSVITITGDAPPPPPTVVPPAKK